MGTFKQLDEQKDIVISIEPSSVPLWSNNNPTLTDIVTGSSQVESDQGYFYINVHKETTDNPVEFSISYAHKYGSGSAQFNDLVDNQTPSKSLYSKYKNLIVRGSTIEDFYFGEDHTSEHFYILNIERSNYKEHLLPGSLSLKLTNSGDDLYLTDNSKKISQPQHSNVGRLFQMVSGSLGTVHTGENAKGYSKDSGSYGWFLPDAGLILLNAEALDESSVNGGISLGTDTTNSESDWDSFDPNNSNSSKMFDAIDEGNSFILNSEETLPSTFVFVRVNNSEFNISNNPSFVDEEGNIIYDDFIQNPVTYITTVGFYNDNNDLLAVAKLSRPLPKNFTKEVLIRAKLNY